MPHVQCQPFLKSEFFPHPCQAPDYKPLEVKDSGLSPEHPQHLAQGLAPGSVQVNDELHKYVTEGWSLSS